MTNDSDAPFWTLAQVINWVSFKDPADLFPFTFAAEKSPLPLPPLSTEPQALQDSDFLPTDDEPPASPAMAKVHTAEAELVRALQAGHIVAWGQRNGAALHISIPREFWLSASLDYVTGGAETTEQFTRDAQRWGNLRFDNKQVLKLWPELRRSNRERKAATKARNEALQREIDEILRDHPEFTTLDEAATERVRHGNLPEGRSGKSISKETIIRAVRMPDFVKRRKAKKPI